MQKDFEFRSFIVFLIFVTGLFIAILVPFFGAIFWAIAIAIIFAPVQKHLEKYFKSSNLATLITLLIAALLVIIPFLLIASAFLQEGFNLYQRVQNNEINFAVYFERLQKAFPSIQQALESVGIDTESIKEKIGEATIIASKFLAQKAIVVSQGTLSLFLQLGILLYVAFFLLRDSGKLILHLHRAIPLGDEREKLFFDKFSEVTRATIKGSLLVAIVQGFLGGFIFWALGLNAALLWGVIMILLSLVPMIGAGLVWTPVAIYFFAVGDWVSGSILMAFGIFVIGLVDNILRPILVGRDTKLPDYLVLLSTLGGFSLFGMNGFVIGPLIAALFMTGWEIFVSEFYTYDEIESNETDDIPSNISVNSSSDASGDMTVNISENELATVIENDKNYLKDNKQEEK